MTIEQTIEVPASHRLVLDLPFHIPMGRVKITVTSEREAANEDRGGLQISPAEALEMACGIAKGSGFTSERLFEMRRNDRELETAQFSERWGLP
jgi:hypothetical protein